MTSQAATQTITINMSPDISKSRDNEIWSINRV